MTEELRTLVLTALEEIIKDIKGLHGEEYVISIREPIPNHIGINAQDFFFMYSIEDNYFYLSFLIDTPAFITAEIVKVITIYIQPTEIVIMHDHYFDPETQTVLYGVPALEAKQRNGMKKRGHKKCVICDRVFEEKHIDENGYCPDCLIIKPNIVWN